MVKLSIVIPAKDVNDPKLKELLKSIESQDFPKEEMEVLVITEGTSESAKAIGIRKAKGYIVGILATDNELIFKDDLRALCGGAEVYGASYPGFYARVQGDDILNRYFALIGGNDPLSYYMKKNDRNSYLGTFDIEPYGKTLGDNGFFVRRSAILKTDLDNYYHIDNANEIDCLIKQDNTRSIWHKTGGNLITFLKKRYRYGLQHAFNQNRRWHLVDFRRKEDTWRLLWFILASVTFIHPLITSFRGYLKTQDIAFLIHPVMTFLTMVTYGILVFHLGIRRLSQSLFVRTEGIVA